MAAPASIGGADDTTVISSWTAGVTLEPGVAPGRVLRGAGLGGIGRHDGRAETQGRHRTASKVDIGVARRRIYDTTVSKATFGATSDVAVVPLYAKADLFQNVAF